MSAAYITQTPTLSDEQRACALIFSEGYRDGAVGYGNLPDGAVYTGASNGDIYCRAFVRGYSAGLRDKADDTARQHSELDHGIAN
jgi:hypothetical protein